MKYSEAFDIALTAITLRGECGTPYSDPSGTAREAALAMVANSYLGVNAIIDACNGVMDKVERARAYRRINPAWDGSIG